MIGSPSPSENVSSEGLVGPRASAIIQIEMSSDHRSLFVGNLSPFVSENHLISLFSHHGPVQTIRIIRDKVTKESLCYGFVEFNTPEEAENIRICLDGVEFYGQNLK